MSALHLCIDAALVALVVLRQVTIQRLERAIDRFVAQRAQDGRVVTDLRGRIEELEGRQPGS